MGHLYADDIVGKTEMLTFCYKIECYHQEFDILALLITHPQRVFTYELIMELVWNEDVTFYSRKAVSNHKTTRILLPLWSCSVYAPFPENGSHFLLFLL